MRTKISLAVGLLHLRDALKRELSGDARRALAILEPWYRAGASSSLTATGAEVAVELNTFFRLVNTDLAFVYGGGGSGLAYFESLDGFASVDPTKDLPFPALTVTDGGTIASQASQSYTQWVPMHDPDQAMSLLPIGQSERPGSSSRTSTMDLWGEGRLHAAPLSRAKDRKSVV